MTDRLCLDLGCGKRLVSPDFIGVDISLDTDARVVHDLCVSPWPFADSSVSQAFSSHFLEHLTGRERMAFMDELWRVLIPGGTATIITPYWTSWRAVADPTHRWPPICEQSYHYFNRKWREENGLGHYSIKCNFSFVYQHVWNPAVLSQDRWDGRINSIDDLRVNLKKEL